MLSIKLVLQPLVGPFFFFLSGVIFSIILHTHCQLRRLCLLPLYLALSVVTFITSEHIWFSPNLGTFCMQAALNCTLHNISLICIEKWPAPSLSPALSKETVSRQWRCAARNTYCLWINPRMRGRTKPTHAQDPILTPSKPRSYSTWVLGCLVKLLVYYYLSSYLLPMIFTIAIDFIRPADVSPRQQHLFRRLAPLTSRDLFIRLHTSTIWILETIIYLNSAHTLLSLVAVLSGLDTPEEWPPLFGNPLQATSLRRFWSRFWHGIVTRTYVSYGTVAVASFGLKAGTMVTKTVVALVIFAISGAVHAVISWQLGDPGDVDIYWFLLNFLACTAEVLFAAALNSAAKRWGWQAELSRVRNSWVGKLLGYAWVLGFFFWSVPMWKYPAMYKSARRDILWKALFSSSMAKAGVP